MKDWRGKWALITGASAGIGVALAEELASGGTNLVLTARRKDRLAELARRLTATHKINSELFPADLADSNATEFAFARFARAQRNPNFTSWPARKSSNVEWRPLKKLRVPDCKLWPPEKVMSSPASEIISAPIANASSLATS